MMNVKLLIKRRWDSKGTQNGASAIEFIILLPFFLIIFFAIVTYSIVFMYTQTLSALSADAARSAIAVYTDRNTPPADRDSSITNRIQSVINNSWIGDHVTGCSQESSGPYHNFKEGLVTICIQTPVPVPVFNLLGIRIPDFDNDMLQSTSSLQLPN